MLEQAGGPVQFVYFPLSCLASTVVILEDGSMAEALTIGKEGFVGASLYFERDTAELTTFIQIPGEALRLDAKLFQMSLEDARFRRVIGNYTGRALATVAQSTACMAFHPLQERLARWLLLVRDGLELDEFPLTQDFLAIMLGVHRPTVTIAVKILQTAGLIQHRRGRVRITDTEGLTSAACECYRRARTSLASDQP